MASAIYASLELVPLHGAAEAFMAQLGAPEAEGVAHTIPAVLRAFQCIYASSQTPKAYVRKKGKSVVKRSPKKQSAVFAIRAAPLTRPQAAMRPAQAAE